MNYYLNCFTDKHKDRAIYMQNANQQGAKIVQYFYKSFLFFGPTSILIGSVASLLYNKFKYDHINPANLYRSFRFSYEFKLNYDFDLKFGLKKKKN